MPLAIALALLQRRPLRNDNQLCLVVLFSQVSVSNERLLPTTLVGKISGHFSLLNCHCLCWKTLTILPGISIPWLSPNCWLRQELSLWNSFYLHLRCQELHWLSIDVNSGFLLSFSSLLLTFLPRLPLLHSRCATCQLFELHFQWSWDTSFSWCHRSLSIYRWGTVFS